MLTVPAEVLFELERELGEPRFMGVPIGSTLGQVFHLDLFLGHGQWDIRSVWKDRFRFWYHYLRGLHGVPRQSAEVGDKADRILVTLASDRPHIRELIVPVLERIGSKECVVLSRDDNSVEQLSADLDFVTVASFSYDPSLWRREIHQCFPVWRTRLKSLLQKYSIPLYIMPRLCDAMLVQSQRVMVYHRLVDTISPRSVITTYDRSDFFSSLILVAKSHNIPTITMLHGVINPPYGYVPLLADWAICWGKQSFDQMVSMGTDPSRLKIAGCQRLSPDLVADRTAARKKFGVTDDRPLILLASNPINVVHRKQFARLFCQALAEQEHFAAAIRLHPSEKLHFYAEEIQDFPSIIFTEGCLMTQDEALAAADIVINRSSGFGNDALVKGKLVVIFDVIDAPLGNAHALIESAACPHVKSVEELRTTIERIVSDPEFQRELKSKAQAFVKYQFAAFDSDAAENVANILLNISGNSGQSLDNNNAS